MEHNKIWILICNIIELKLKPALLNWWQMNIYDYLAKDAAWFFQVKLIVEGQRKTGELIIFPLRATDPKSWTIESTVRKVMQVSVAYRKITENYKGGA